MKNENSVNWDNIKVVIFDVDGTLYTQSKLRKRMLGALVKHYAIRPWRYKELKMLQLFRSEREKKAGFSGTDLEGAQYQWCAEKANYPVAKLKEIVQHWMFEFPNKYLAKYVFPGLQDLFILLRRNGYPIAIYSDYKADDKMKAMGLQADLIVSSTDPHISRLKPDPKGLFYIAEKMGVQPSQCLFIDDREELDGQCAINAGMPYLILDKKPFNSFDFYKKLQLQFQ